MWRVRRSARCSRGSDGELVPPSAGLHAQAALLCPFSYHITPLTLQTKAFWARYGPAAVARTLQLWSSGSSRRWAWQRAVVSRGFVKGNKGSSQGAFCLLGVIFRYFWAVHRKAGVLSNIPNVDKVAQSWEKQDLGLGFGPSPKSHVAFPCSPQPPHLCARGTRSSCLVPSGMWGGPPLFQQPSLPKQLLPIPCTGKELVEAPCGLGLAHRSRWCSRIRQMIPNVFQGQVLCQDEVKRI